MVEKFTINQANKINIVSGGFKAYFEKYFKQKKYLYFQMELIMNSLKELKGKIRKIRRE